MYYNNNPIKVLASINLQENLGIYNVNKKGHWAWAILNSIPKSLWQRRNQLFEFWNAKYFKK